MTLRARLEAMPPGSLVPVTWLLEQLSEDAPAEPAAAAPVADARTSWRERLWTVPAETQLTVPEAAEACGHPPSWGYRRTCRITPKERARAAERGGRVPDRLPCRKVDGRVWILAGELRAWLQRNNDAAIVARPRAIR